MNLRGVQLTAVLGLASCIFSAVLLLIGVIFPNWHDNAGLWEDCSIGNVTDCQEITYKHSSGTVEYLWVSQGLLSVGIGVSLITICLLIFSAARSSSIALKLAGVASLLAGVMACVGVVLYSSGFLLHLKNSITVPDGWAFWVTCGGSGIQLILGVTLIILTCPCKQTSDDQARIL